MKQVTRLLVLALVTTLVAVVFASPALAAKSGVVKGTLVSYDAEASKLVVESEGGGEKVTLTTTKRTAVEGLNPAATDMQSADALDGLEGVFVTVKWKETGDGPVARFVRVYPRKS